MAVLTTTLTYRFVSGASALVVIKNTAGFLMSITNGGAQQSVTSRFIDGTTSGGLNLYGPIELGEGEALYWAGGLPFTALAINASGATTGDILVGYQ